MQRPILAPALLPPANSAAPYSMPLHPPPVDTLNAQPFEAGAQGGHHAPREQNSGGNAPNSATAMQLTDEAEPESVSWIDVRV